MREMETDSHEFYNSAEIEDTCAAENLNQYCHNCSTGLTCCTKTDEEMEARCEDDAMIKQIEEAVDMFKYKQKIKRDNSNQMSEEEIAKRLFGTPMESTHAEGPLDVIMEINGEEDDFVNAKSQDNFSSSLGRLQSSLTFCSNLTENFVVNSECTSSMKTVNSDASRSVIPNEFHERKNFKIYPTKGNIPMQNSWTKQSPNNANHRIIFPQKIVQESSNENGHFSYNKANKLISEIENCFTETTCLVEKTLQSTHSAMQNVSQHNSSSLNNQRETLPCKSSSVSNEISNPCKKVQRIRKSVEEAINLFDSIINEDSICNPNIPIDSFTKSIPTQADNTRENKENYPTIASPTTVNEGLIYIKDLDTRPKNVIAANDHPTYQSVSTKPRNSFRRSLFDAEIDELFKECYDLAAIEPSTSLDSCLKNLESLCLQLKKARSNIIKELKADQGIGYVDESPDDELYKEALSLLHHDRFSLINDVIERKVNTRKPKKKFSLGPPLMGLEGKTHKIIAEVTPKYSCIENGWREENENLSIFSEDYVNSMSLENNSSYSIRDSFFKTNYPHQQDFGSSEYAYDHNSDLSTTTNTYESIYADDSSLSLSDPNNTDVLNTSKDEMSSVMSQEETLALYADNQELQESLLSILHCLNDIHDNFLKRRRMETEKSQQSSSRIHNKILSILSTGSQLDKKKLAHDYVNIPLNLNTSQRNSFEDDFEAIEKIIKVSDELKNLWLSQTPDFSMKRKIPTRTKSFSNRFDRKYKTTKYRRNINNPTPKFDTASGDSLSLNKCYSMPNLIAIDLDTPTEERLINFPSSATGNPFYFSNSILKERQCETPSTEVKNFVKQLKIENEKCYAITLNFLKRIMSACKAIEESEGIGQTSSNLPQQACLASF